MLYRELVEDHMDDPRVVLSDGVREFTFSKLHKRVMQYCAFFQKQLLKKGDRVAIVDHDPMETVLVLLACIAGGYIFVPINSHLDEESQNMIIQDSTPKVFLNSQNNIDRYEACDFRSVSAVDTLVYLVYTSGSEGTPKGVVASQRQILFCSHAINARLRNGKDDRILCSLPLSFDYGMYQVFLSFLSGAVLFLDRGDIVQRIPFLLNNWSITGFPTIPSVANLLIRAGLFHEATLQHLRYITFTGEVLPVSLLQKLREQLPHVSPVPMYGLTECKRVSIMPYGCEEKVMKGSCGLPLDSVSVWLEHIDESSGVGELVVEGDNVMEGYWGYLNKEVSPFALNKKTGKRILYTGDLFTIDEEGFLYFHERKNNILKIRGYRVSAVWIEQQLSIYDCIREIAVIGVPDPLTSEKAIAFVYTTSEATRAQVIDHLSHLPKYLQGIKVIFTQEPLPKNQNGKIDKRILRHIAEANL